MELVLGGRELLLRLGILAYSLLIKFWALVSLHHGPLVNINRLFSEAQELADLIFLLLASLLKQQHSRFNLYTFYIIKSEEVGGMQVHRTALI